MYYHSQTSDTARLCRNPPAHTEQIHPFQKYLGQLQSMSYLHLPEHNSSPLLPRHNVQKPKHTLLFSDVRALDKCTWAEFRLWIPGSSCWDASITFCPAVFVGPVRSFVLFCVTEPKLSTDFIFVQYSFYNFLQNKTRFYHVLVCTEWSRTFHRSRTSRLVLLRNPDFCLDIRWQLHTNFYKSK